MRGNKRRPSYWPWPVQIFRTTCFSWLDVHKLCSSVHCCIEMAVLNLAANACGEPVRKILNPTASDTLVVNGLLAGTPEEMIATARELMARGYTTLKMKVGRMAIKDEVELVRDVIRLSQDEFGDELDLRLDANRAWTYKQALQFASVLGAAPREYIEYIEEPLANAEELARFIMAEELPIALDETIVRDPMLLPRLLPLAEAIILKPTLIRGFESAYMLGAAAAGLKACPVVSSTFESSVGLHAIANFAASFTDPHVAVGLDTAGIFEHDVCREPLPVVGGHIDLHAADEAVKTIDLSRLKEVARA
ncbi:MAG: o-succinylbenzoate synthase [Candidatus Hydrogenedentes bacterium]|nr:o-succinylbenzoate synthase [Candidatus Hydrogenedentota bacterium]